MAKVRYGSIVTELKGHIAGQVFQGGNVGYVLRNKGYTPGFTSGSRQTAIQAMTSQTSRWRALTDVQRAAWAAVGSSWPFKDKFGNTYTASGFQIFTAYNSNLLSIGQSVVNTPSSIYSPTNPGPVALLCQTDGSTVGVLVDWENAGSTNDYLVILASIPFSAGQNGNFVPVRKIFGASINGASDIDAGATYKSLYGVPPLGSKVKIIAYFRDGRWPINAYAQSAAAIVTVI